VVAQEASASPCDQYKALCSGTGDQVVFVSVVDGVGEYRCSSCSASGTVSPPPVSVTEVPLESVPWYLYLMIIGTAILVFLLGKFVVGKLLPRPDFPLESEVYIHCIPSTMEDLAMKILNPYYYNPSKNMYERHTSFWAYIFEANILSALIWGNNAMLKKVVRVMQFLLEFSIGIAFSLLYGTANSGVTLTSFNSCSIVISGGSSSQSS
jgi:hypothetical protein